MRVLWSVGAVMLVLAALVACGGADTPTDHRTPSVDVETRADAINGALGLDAGTGPAADANSLSDAADLFQGAPDQLIPEDAADLLTETASPQPDVVDGDETTAPEVESSDGADTSDAEILPRRTYTVGFILLFPEQTDLTSTQAKQQIVKLEAIKLQLVEQFEAATDGTGRVDVAYPVVAMAPPNAVGQETSALAMWDFLQDLVKTKFFAAHGDQFDFLAIYEAYPDKTMASRHRTIKRVVAGFGMTEFDTAAAWGSTRLRGVGLITDITALPEQYAFLASKMHLLLHEVFGHQWGVYAKSLSKTGSHFHTGIAAPAHTVLYGRPWRQDDATHFHVESVVDPQTGEPIVVFHPWMLYVAGLKTREEVPESILKVTPDIEPQNRYDVYATTGTVEILTLQQVIDESGDRYDVPQP